MQVGFIGLGTMGSPMAINLVKAGYALRVWNRSGDAAAALESHGAIAVSAPSEAAEGVDVLISMLSDDATTSAVVIGSGVMERLKPGAVFINMATVSALFARNLAEQCKKNGVSYVAAPVLGRVNVAEAGQLNILAAGDSAVMTKVQPLFDVLGQKTWYFGDKPYQANVAKLAANFMIASAIETMGEAVSLVRGHDISAEAFLEMMTSTLFAAPVYKGYGDAISHDRFEPAGFKLALGLKDVRLLLEAGEEAHVPLPVGSVIRDSFLDNLAHGEGQLDWAALSQASARRSGQK